MVDEELAAIGVWLTSISHSKSTADVIQIRSNLVLETSSFVFSLILVMPDGLTTCTVPFWISSLDHKAIDDTVEGNTVIVAFFGMSEEIFNR
ncbi:Uncharacterised protein [Streptococcus pneumoniae]|nr:Uncharacterised protein [Streptococcus pneumoniae]